MTNGNFQDNHTYNFIVFNQWNLNILFVLSANKPHIHDFKFTTYLLSLLLTIIINGNTINFYQYNVVFPYL